MEKNDLKKRVFNPKRFLVRMNKLYLISLALLSLSVFVLGEKTTVFLEPFNTSPLHANYSITKLDDGGSKVQFNNTSSPTHLQIYNDNGSTDGSGTNKRAYMTRSLDDFSSPYMKKLNENDVVTWTFNMRHSKGSITPHINGELALGDNNYAQLMVLVSSNADFLDATTNGYAVTLTRDGSGTTIFKLVRFAAGLSATSNLTTLITSTSGSIPGTNWASVKVAYESATDTWSLYLRDDATTASTGTDKDPMDEAAPYTTIGSVVDATYTATEMTSFGFFANTGKARGGNNAKALYDNFGVQVGASTAASQESRLSELKVDKLGGTDYVDLTRFSSNVYNYQYYLTKDQTIIPTISAVRVDTKASNPVITPASSLTGTQMERTAKINITAEDGVTTSEYNIEFIKTDNVFQNGIAASGSNTPPAGWASSSMYFAADNNGNDRYQGYGYARCHTSSTSSTLTLPQAVSIGTLSFYAKKIDANYTGNIKISTKIDDGAWTVISDLGDINNTGYEVFTIPVNQTGAESILIRLDITKQEGSAIYYFDDFAYTASGYEIVFSGTGNWSETARWNTGLVPGATDDIVINGEMTVNSSANAKDVVVGSYARIAVENGSSLSVENLTLQSSAAGTASLINNGTLTVSGTTTVQQYLTAKTGETNDNWWYISSPVTGATSASILVGGNNNKFGYYDEMNATYPQITATDVTLHAGRGYVAQINTTATYEFTGILNSGDIPVTLTRTTSAGGPRGFNLVGNPYTSHINWNTITGFGTGSQRTDIRSTVWVRTRTAGGAMAFDTFNGEVAVNNGVRGAMNQYIAPMQAFWVKVHEDNTEPVITFTNAIRSQQNQSESHNRLRAPAQLNRKLLRLELDNGVNTDQLLIYTSESAQNGYDFLDSEKMSANNASIAELYSVVADRDLVINSRRDISEGDAVMLGFRPGQTGVFTIRATELTYLDQLQVILKDHLMNTETELTATSGYEFTADATPTSDRFSVEFRAPGHLTAIDDVEAANAQVFVNAAKQITVQSAGLSKEDRISVYNLAGQQLTSQAASGANSVVELPLNAGVYMVKINNHSYKVIVK